MCTCRGRGITPLCYIFCHFWGVSYRVLCFNFCRSSELEGGIGRHRGGVYGGYFFMLMHVPGVGDYPHFVPFLEIMKFYDYLVRAIFLAIRVS